MSIRAKYVLGVTGVVAVLTGLLTYWDVKKSEKRIHAESLVTVSTVTKLVKNGLMSVMLEGRAADFRGFVETLIADNLSAVRVFREDGSLICSSVAQERIAGLNRKIAQQLDIATRQKGGHLVYAMTMPIYNERPCHRCHGMEERLMAAVEVEVLIDSVYVRLREMRESAALSYFLVLLVVPGVLWMATTSLVTKPLKGMLKAAKQVEDGDLKTRFQTKGTDEIGKLGEGIDSMLNELVRARQHLEACHMEAMQKAEKMATIGELASAIAHEIKNPLAGISGAIQVLAEEFDEKDPRKVIIREVLREIERLDKAVRDLLNFARPPEPNRIRTRIAPVLDRAVRLLNAQARKQGVLINTVSLNEPRELSLDPDQMQQVFVNIMMNALHSMPGGGSITVAAFEKTDPKEFEVVVSDTGYGIPHEALNNIFKPFFTTKHMGTGLGLAISKNIVEKHGGRITVESQVGVGSSFHVILPVEAEHAG